MRAFLFLFSILLSVSTLAQTNDSPESNTKVWNEADPLVWGDYWAEPEETLIMAQTRFKIDIFPGNVAVDANDYIQNLDALTVKAVFYKDKSWSLDKQSAQLLYHEQLRFNIAEIYARKIRRRFDQLKQSGEKRFAMFQREYAILWKECLEYQREFEKATEFGNNNLLDQEWNETIQTELLVLKAYQ